jgi:methyl-accepting chemotaxis protein
MNFLQNLKIGTRLSIGFAALILLSLLAGALGVERIVAVRTIADRLGTEDAELLVDTQGWVRAIEANTARTWVVFFATDPKVVGKVKQEMKDTMSAQTERLKRMSALAAVDPEMKRIVDEISRERDIYQSMRGQLLKRLEGGENVNDEVVAKVFPAAADYLASVNRLVEYQDHRLKATKDAADAAAGEGVMALGAGCALALLVGLWFAVALTRSVVQPVLAAQELAKAIAAGDLTRDVRTGARDEIGQLMQSMGAMVQSLRGIVGAVRSSSESIATGSREIATGNADLSQRTEEQAANLQQTAASMEQLSSTVNNNAVTAVEAERLAGSASDIAAQGGTAVGQVVHTMEAISASSRKIADIIGVIDGIAFQTNILALNAAVEAARAGEQGRGFAVVAGEVRLLAQRSAEAAREIKSLITDSAEKVEAGSRQVDAAGRTMSDIVAQVKRVNELIGEISNATQAQKQGIGQVSGAVSQLDQVTQQNAALVEQSAAAAESLSQQTRHLVDAVSQFKLGREELGA